MKAKILNSLLLLLPVLAFIGCNTDDDYYYYYPDPNVSLGMIANASPDSGDLFFYADANSINSTALNYPNAAGYYNFYLGDRTFSIQDASGNELATVDKTLEAGTFFSVFAVNTFANIELVVYDDVLEYPSTADKSMVRFINLSPDAPAIGVSLQENELASGIEFKQATDFIEIDSGTHTLTFTNPDGEVLYTYADVNFTPKSIYTIYTKGYVTPPDGSNDSFSTRRIRNWN